MLILKAKKTRIDHQEKVGLSLMIVPDLEVALLLVEEDVVQAPGDEGVEDQEVLHLGAEDLEAVRQEVVADLKVHRLNVGNAPQLLSQRRLTLIC